VFFPTAGIPFLEKQISHMEKSMSDCSTDSTARREIEEATIHLFTVATQGACRRRATVMRSKTWKMSRIEGNSEGEVL
jgi:hypothetical protein